MSTLPVFDAIHSSDPSQASAAGLRNPALESWKRCRSVPRGWTYIARDKPGAGD